VVHPPGNLRAGPTVFTMDQLTGMPSHSLPVLLVCAGNRRKEENMVKQTIGEAVFRAPPARTQLTDRHPHCRLQLGPGWLRHIRMDWRPAVAPPAQRWHHRAQRAGAIRLLQRTGERAAQGQ
jgi:Oxidoreductase molybdopterin binding domain